MAGHDQGAPDGKDFKGLSKYFNSFTMEGRRNVAVVSLSTMALAIGYFYFRKKKEKK